jgi:S1-C subfamily serine protease
MKLCIQAVDFPKKPVYEFDGPTVTMGRDGACNLPLKGTTNVSGRHAQIALTPDGAFLTDLASTNGTFLNDRRIEGRKKLRKGDYFRLGQTGPGFQIIELDLTSAAPLSPAILGTAVEKVARVPVASLAEPGYAAPDKMPPVAKAKAKPLPEASQPTQAGKSAPTAASGQTRLMVVALQKSNRNLMIGVGAAVAALLLIIGGSGIYLAWKQRDLSSQTANLGDTTKKLQEKADDLNQSVGKVSTNIEKLSQKEGDVYKKLLPSTAWILNQQGKSLGAGTGSLIDQDRRLVLSNHHVAAQGQKVIVFFPSYDAHGKVKMSTDDYPFSDAIQGTAVLSDPKCDLCLIRLEKTATDPRPIGLAAKSAEPGDRIHSIGNFRGFGTPGSDRINNGVLWSYAGGSVRNVRQNKLVYGPNQVLDSWVLETQSPINQGDSGGPVVNDNGELVAVVSSFDTKTRLVSSFIDIREVHAFVGRYSAK